MMKRLTQLLIAAALIHSAGGRTPALRLDLGGGAEMEFARVEAGEFRQGSPGDEPGRRADETERQVRITAPFYLGRYPVTRAQWERFVAETNFRTEAEKGTSGGFGVVDGKLTQRRDFTWRNPGFAQTSAHPVTGITWFDAKEFLQWLSRRTGRRCALPTEAQWEYACRAGTATAWPTGADAAAAGAWAWHKGNAGFTTHPVGEKTPNAWGLWDMGGQVWEWCEDWYGPYPPGPVTDPLQTLDNLSDKPRRVLRGGSFLKDVPDARSAARFRNDARSRNADNGFRVLVSTDSGTPPPAQKAAQTTPELTLEPDSAEGSTRRIVLPSPPPSSPAARPPAAAPWLFLLFALIAVVIVWRILRRIAASFRGAPARPPVPAAATGQPTVRTADDGFWVCGNFPPGTMISWMHITGGHRQEGCTVWQPGPKGMFLFTGAAPDVAEAWIENDPDAPSAPYDPYSQGMGAGLLSDRLAQQRTEPPPQPPPSRGSWPSAY